MKIDDVMTRDVLTVTPQTPYKEVVERLVECEFSGLPVVDAAGALVGIVTEADLISKAAYGGHRSRALALLADVLSARPHNWVTKSLGSVAADVMSTDLVVCTPDEDLQLVARRMLSRGVKRIPVVHAGHLVGIVSRHDLLKSFTREDAAIAAEVRKVLATDLNRLDDCHVLSSVENGIVTLHWRRALRLGCADRRGNGARRAGGDRRDQPRTQPGTQPGAGTAVDVRRPMRNTDEGARSL